MSKDKDDTGEDFVFVGQPSDDGFAPCIRHRPDHSIEAAVLGPTADGEAVDGSEIVNLTPREAGGYSVEVVHDGRKGPSKVATKAYRDGWENIFGKKQAVGQA